ncbi:DUF87 domain-containing protein [Tissierella sp. MSJ-40]|uniref:DUF87 domain-containing protein n=1 Tax=Tissierella simiarum TaxID=2841534 RepID=A0ABS6EAP2_9FIRM|nr:DUF87 domain-containing protein [Tissierella simiarum]
MIGFSTRSADPGGFYIGKDKYGSNIIIDFNQRAKDKTNSSILVLGNSGGGKSYLLKLLLTNLRDSGKHVLLLDLDPDPESGGLLYRSYGRRAPD